MRIQSIHLQTQNKLIQDYRNKKSTIMQHFDYNPFESNVFQKRKKDLKNKNVNRKQLSDVLHTINTKWNAPTSTIENIGRLRDADSLVVIGGQQAGLLTGPMYTINKIISIIHLAKQQEEQLQVPVIPVFWIAGEDHDFDEINHIFLSDTSQMKKYTLLQREIEKKAVSNIAIDDEQANDWLKRLFVELNETLHTKELYNTIRNFLNESDTYVDFFARMIYWLFNEEGLVLVDSNHRQVRNLESNYFVDLIDNQSKTTHAINRSFEEVAKQGYALSVDVDDNDANLFYQNGMERVLLVRDDNDDWIGKNKEVKFTTEELLDIARNKPKLLSNNVMTRPLMQEMLFPSLAFIGGPGEISYWSILKKAFHANNMKMPPIVPRLSFTLMEPHIEKLLTTYHIDAEHAVNNGVIDRKDRWLEEKYDPPVKQLAKQLKQTIDGAHEPLRDLAESIQSDLADLANTNLKYLYKDVEFLEKRITKTLEKKYAKELHEFNLLQLALHPNNGLQERVWNPLPWMNRYGIDFIKQLSNESCSYDKEHFLIYL
ncbi:bacillithiol biosynthesis cysteine-adding enzyme BshC [Virgibacillus necropolis]|uniref:Putative cysteine ligase BshC n=1 Tax=Virgibacillus necropolis TaxID=163877 RepID=A0A221ME64_9BACI|nr:bacillithiol biosynthesis cysteine-adding enzyme BshC [Virgibacillus necropolis]ASN05859.1 bacillithiol biosynthesis cysteine-adding enzyme BshC [Virgibacillus necropolis]